VQLGVCGRRELGVTREEAAPAIAPVDAVLERHARRRGIERDQVATRVAFGLQQVRVDEERGVVERCVAQLRFELVASGHVASYRRACPRGPC
jgi:hypothetical protein